jgi:hypothetical protein
MEKGIWGARLKGRRWGLKGRVFGKSAENENDEDENQRPDMAF